MSDDTSVRLYQMGEAYKKITEILGPSAQLVAFINYEDSTEGVLGLESLDVNEQHTKILAEIEALSIPDSIAQEGLFSKLFGSKVPSHAAFEEAQKLHGYYTATANQLISKLPSDGSLSKWKAYETLVDRDFEEEVSRMNQAAAKNKRDNVSFESSGWTKENHTSAVQWVEAKEKENKLLHAKYEPKVQELHSRWQNADNKKDGDDDHAQVTQVMNYALAQCYKACFGLDEVTTSCRTMLNKVEGKLT